MATTAEKKGNGCLVSVIVLVVLAVGLALGLWSAYHHVFGFRLRQPVYGYTGDWKFHNVNAEEERPLPPAAEIWRYDDNWKPTNAFAFKFYLARLGHAERQLN